MSVDLLVNEIFDSIEGEGKRAGQLATFIRLTGCNLRCSYCDTEYAFTEGKAMSIDKIMSNIKYHNVTITGGEPLYQDISILLDRLKFHSVNIETNGSLDITKYFKYPHVWFTADYKTKSSCMNSAMHLDNLRNLRPQDVLKFVVKTHEDCAQAFKICKEYNPICKVYISPVFGEIEPKQIVGFMKDNHIEDWNLQIQLHKIIWDAQKRGV